MVAYTSEYGSYKIKQNKNLINRILCMYMYMLYLFKHFWMRV